MRTPIYLVVLALSAAPACTSRRLPEQHSPGLAAADEESFETGEEAPLDDGGDEELDAMPGSLPPPTVLPPHPLEGMSDEEVEALLLADESKLGPASLGKTNSGALFGAIPMPKNELWNIVNSRETYGTQETIDYLSHTIARVNEIYPGSPVINIGDISKPKGGYFVPHVSHQSGRDVDLGFYYNDASVWYAKADASNLDLPRTWALVKLTITETDVQAIFLDREIQRILRDYATELGEDPEWLDAVFGGPTSELRPMILHEPGHDTHLHIRYYNPVAQETGRRIYKHLVKHEKIKPPTYYVHYKAKRGDSLIRIAKKHNSSVKALQQANHLRNTRIYAGRSYKIPRRGGVAEVAKLSLPARRIPKFVAAWPPAAEHIASDATETASQPGTTSEGATNNSQSASEATPSGDASAHLDSRLGAPAK